MPMRSIGTDAGGLTGALAASQAMAGTESGNSRGERAMDLNVAIQKHAEWKFKFRNAMLAKASMDDVAIAKDNLCELGKWLHGEAKTLYGKKAEYARCLADHAVFHKEAGKVAAVISAKNREEAERMISGESAFTEASKKVSVSLIELKNAILA
jgi:methyl-accepting chemotaxis protein